MGKPYIAIDFFVPSRFRPRTGGGEEYGHDSAAIHLLVQPFLLSRHTDALSVADYLTHWGPAELAANGVGWIDETLANRIRSKEVEALPVPLPPDTTLSFWLSWTYGDGSAAPTWGDDRHLGSSTPDGQPVTDPWQLPGSGTAGWPGFARLGNAIPMVTRYADLDGAAEGPEKAQVRLWLRGLFAEMHRLWVDGTDNRPATDPRPALWQTYVRPHIAEHPPGRREDDFWDAYLEAPADSGKPRAAEIYDQLLAASVDRTYAAEPGGLPPRFRWQAAALDAHPELFVEPGHAGRSYLHALWSELKQRVEAAAPEVEQALRRLYGFGERLAWPRTRLDAASPENSKRFMVLKETHSTDPAWFVTNMVSLAGQVFRLHPFDFTKPVASVTLDHFTIEGQTPGTGTQAFTERLAEGIGLVHAGAAQTSETATIRVEPALGTYLEADETGTIRDRTRLVVWHPRAAPAQPLAETAVPAGQPATHAVPASLLDAVDPAARNGRAVPDRLTETTPPRRGLRLCELVEPQSLSAFTRLLRLPARLDLLPLPECRGALGEGAGRNERKAAYVLRLTVGLHPGEAAVIGWLTGLADGTAPGGAALWIPQQNAQPVRFPLTLGELRRHEDEQSIVIIDDRDTLQDPQSLSHILAGGPGQGGPSGGQQGWTVDLIFDTAKAADDPFNLLQGGPGAPPELALARGLISRVGRSTERIMERLALTWDPPFTPDIAKPDDPILESQAANADKLRLDFVDPLLGTEVALCDPDALLPLPARNQAGDDRPWRIRGPVDPGGPQAAYWLAHHFAHDLAASDKMEAIKNAEALRFAIWVGAGRPAALQGYVEHQYGHRLPTVPLSLPLCRATDVAHPALVSPTGWVSDEQPRQAREPPRRPLLRLNEDPLNLLRVEVMRKPIRLAIERLNAPQQPEGGSAAAPIRAVYEAFAELRDALSAGTAVLRLEPWVFDNTIAQPVPGNDDLGLTERPVPASLVRWLRSLDAREVPLSLANTGTGLRRVLDALDLGFEKWIAELSSVVPADKVKDTADGDEAWSTVHEEPIDAFSAVANFVRAGLRLRRPDNRLPDPGWSDDAIFVPLDSGARADRRLAERARADLRAALDRGAAEPSRLVQAFAWTEAAPPPPDTPGAALHPHLPVLVGEHAATLYPPRAPTLPVENVVDLFYVLHAFVLPRAHPALGDRQATADFAAWLLGLLEDLIEGRDIGGKIQIAGPVTADSAFKRRKGARALILRVAERVLHLLKRVDNQSAIAANPGHTAAEKALFGHVNALVASLDGSSIPKEQRLGQVLLRLVGRRPTLFSEARGIAVAAFNDRLAPEEGGDATACNAASFSPRLYDLSIEKILESDDGVETADRERFDVTRLYGSQNRRYFLDVLQDRLYDDTFRVAQNTYTGIPPTDTTRLGEPHRLDELKETGGTTARSAEMAIQSPTGRQIPDIAANVVHHNPAWRVRRNGGGRVDYLHLLPERRVPPPFRPVTAIEVPGAQDPHRSAVAVDLSRGNAGVKLKEQWRHSADTALNAMTTVRVRFDKTADTRVFARLAPHGTDPDGGAAPPAWRAEQAEGWHHLSTYLSHSWFSFDLQKRDETLQSNLDDDVYEMEVEMWNGTPPAPDFPEDNPPSPAQEPLLQWFGHWRDRQRGKTDLPSPPPVSGERLLDGLEDWLVTAPATAPWSGRTVLDEPPAPIGLVGRGRAGGAYWRQRRFRMMRRAGDVWRVEEVDPTSPDGVGGVLAVEILGAVRADGGQPEMGDRLPPERLQAVMRVTILDHPFHISRVRVRVVRNWKTVDDDSVPDIAPDFLLAERFCDWTTRGAEPLRVTPADFAGYGLPEPARELRVVPTDGDVPKWLGAWLGAGPGTRMSFGDALPRAVRHVAFTDEDNRPHTLWEVDSMLDQRFDVDGFLYQDLADVAPHVGLAGPAAHPAARDIVSTRQLLPIVNAAALHTLTDAIAPAEVLTVEPSIEVVWRGADGLPVLAVRWPVRIRPRA